MRHVTSEDGTDSEKWNMYELEKCAEWIKTNGMEKICLQFPDDLLCDSVDVASCLEKLIDKRVYILGDTSYGSCCVDEIAAQHINADCIIHFGHACLSPTARVPVFHIFPKKQLDVPAFCNKFETFFQEHECKLLFFYDVAYAHLIESIVSYLKPIFTGLVVSTLNCTSGNKFVDAQGIETDLFSLGRHWNCENECTTEDYEAFYLGCYSKTLTSLALSIPAKKWYCLQNEDIIEFSTSGMSWLKRRRYFIEKLKEAQVVGIIVATLGIKKYLQIIEKLKTILKEKNKKTYVISVGKINPMKLANFPEVDVFVAITCPENEVFESREFMKPILLPYEVDLAFNTSRGFSLQYPMDFREILLGGNNYVQFKSCDLEGDVSLLSNTIRTDAKQNLVDQMDTLVLRSTAGDVAVIGKTGAQFLRDRSWMGIEQRIGEDIAKPSEIGRSGIPSRYENEPVNNDNDQDQYK